MIYVENKYVLPAQASYQLINKHCNISIAYISFVNYNKHKRGTIQAKGIHVSIKQISRFHCQAYCKVRYNINPA